MSEDLMLRMGEGETVPRAKHWRGQDNTSCEALAKAGQYLMRSIGEEFLSGFFNAPWYFRRVRVLCGAVWQAGYFVTWQTGNASISVGRLS